MGISNEKLTIVLLHSFVTLGSFTKGLRAVVAKVRFVSTHVSFLLVKIFPCRPGLRRETTRVTLTRDTARTCLLDHVADHVCYGREAAKAMVITDMECVDNNNNK